MFKGSIPQQSPGHLQAVFGSSCYKAFNIWNTSNDASLTNFSWFNISLDSSEVVVLWIEPNPLAVECVEAIVKH